MASGEVQDITHKLRGMCHYMLEHFKERVAQCVKLGLLLRDDPSLAERADIPEVEAKRFVNAAKVYADYRNYSEEDWRRAFEEDELDSI